MCSGFATTPNVDGLIYAMGVRTSVAVAALDPNHEAHPACRAALVELRPALAGHAAFEVYSVLTRLPVPLRLGPVQAAQVLEAASPRRAG